MRIGNLDEQNHADGLAELIEAGSPDQMTKSQRRKNWWHYYKWYVIIGVILFAALIHIAGNAMGLFTKSPDLQIAYVGGNPLPEDTVTALEQLFAGLIEDFNRDGDVIVQVNQYTGDPNASDAETAYYQYASEITLIFCWKIHRVFSGNIRFWQSRTEAVPATRTTVWTARSYAGRTALSFPPSIWVPIPYWRQDRK